MKKITLLLLWAMMLPALAVAQSVAGSWIGAAKFGPVDLTVVFNIEQSGESYSATMDSPDQGAMGIPMESVSFDGSKLNISAPALANMSYDAVLANDELTGTLSQGGQKFTLDMKRGEHKVSRPQTPEPPYPYISEDIVFLNAEAGINLAGTLTMPSSGTAHTAVILISGSGAQNRDEELMGHKPFLVIADHFTRQGIAVLRYDDRGTAQSEGDYDSATLEDFASDAKAALIYLRSRPEINSNQIGLLGHSEGGTIAFIIAGGDYSSKPDFIVSMAGMATEGHTLLKEQRRLISEAMGVPAIAIEQNEVLVTTMQDIIDKNGAAKVNENPMEYVGTLIGGEINDQNRAVAEQLAGELKRMASPELQSLLNYDPSTSQPYIEVPILAVGGEKDLQVPVGMTFDSLREYVKHDLLTLKSYPDMNHLFQPTQTGMPTEYGNIEMTISEEVLRDMAGWINERNAR